MQTDRFQIVISGKLLPGRDFEPAVAALARLFKAPESRVQRLLSGNPTRLEKIYSQQRAEQIRSRLEAHGIESELQAAAEAQTPRPAETVSLAVKTSMMRCPKCDQEQPEADVCGHCGIVIHKFVQQQQRKDIPRPAVSPRVKSESSFPYHGLQRLLQSVFLLSLVLTVSSCWQKDQLPAADFYDQTLLTDPLQTKTSMEPFQTEANGIVYQIDPVFDYQLQGMVVSFHDSDTWWDIYHHKDWKDFINIKDLCVIWGGNVSSEVYREMEFKNTTWTCWAYWPNREVARRFSMQQLSNNHLLANDPDVLEAIMSAEPGDQIAFDGVLAGYSHSNGKFKRGTSTNRTDTGNGACETIFVRDFQILKKANQGWRLTHSLSKTVLILSLICLGVMLFVAPARRAARL